MLKKKPVKLALRFLLAVKLLMMRIPEKSSWIYAVTLEDFFRNVCHLLCATI